MNSIAEIMRRIRRVIDIEIGITQREAEKFEEKKHAEESYWGIGGNYRRYEKCVEAREKHIEELEALKKQSLQDIQLTEELKLYPWSCPSCQMIIYLENSKSRYGGNSEIIDCPVCSRTLYRSGHYTTWQIVKGSRRTELRDWR